MKTIGVAMLTTVCHGKETRDVRYYIRSQSLRVKEFARAVRGHRPIENGCHWVLDMVYREDESRIRNERLRENVAWLNRFTLSLLIKQHPAKTSVAGKRLCCAWSDDFLLQLATGTGRECALALVLSVVSKTLHETDLSSGARVGRFHPDAD